MVVRLAAAPLQAGRYVMYGAIGAGGMATVHLGRLAGEEGFGRTVAIKRLREHLLDDPEVLRSFLDEAKIAARIRHANVVSTIDIVSSGDELLVVMEYIEGEALSALSKSAQGEAIALGITTAIVAGALRGLHAAHEAVSEDGTPLRIVHRDVSPHNIIVGTDGVPRVLDFGIAKALGRQQTTRDGALKGKLSYMAPEQLSGGGVTRRTDVFAAGIVLWELLAGRRLFGADDEAQTVERVLHAPVPPPSRFAPAVPPVLDAIVLRALARDPIRRFATADQMAVALEEAFPPARSRAVGEWVVGLAEENLAVRAQMIRDIETNSMKVVRASPRPPRSEEAAPRFDVDATFAPTESRSNQRRVHARRSLTFLAFALASATIALVAWIAGGHAASVRNAAPSSSAVAVVPPTDSTSATPFDQGIASSAAEALSPPAPSTLESAGASSSPVLPRRAQPPRRRPVTAPRSSAPLYSRD